MRTPKSALILTSSPSPLQPALDLLTERGVSVSCVEGPYRFTAAFVSEPTDVAILDIEDFRRRDLELLTVLREFRPNVGIILLMDAEQRELAGEALCAGADVYLLKPIQGPELIAATERATLRQQLADTERTRSARAEVVSRLALGVAHEINNPLTTISGWIQMLSADRADDPKLAEILRSIKEDADRIAAVVRQLQVFAQKGPPSTEEVDIARVIAELHRLHVQKCKSKGIDLRAEVAPNLPSSVGDEAQLRQAFDVILAQAEAALTEGGKIQITGRSTTNGIKIVFRDNGPPLPKEALSRVFEPFRDARNGHVNGMGLALSEGIIRSHGGRIEAKSRESKGNQVSVWLPTKE